jgi:hypothetical protein
MKVSNLDLNYVNNDFVGTYVTLSTVTPEVYSYEKFC